MGSISLYQLIGQLSSSEKRFFHLLSNRHSVHGKNDYFTFYKSILSKNTQKDADVEYEITKTPLAILKVQLFENILHSLHLFHSSSSTMENLSEKLHQIGLLINKGFDKEAAKRLKKVRIIIERHEFFDLMIRAYQLEEKIIARNFYEDCDFEYLTSRENDFKLTLKRIANLEAYNLLFAQIYKLHFQSLRSRKQEDTSKFESWFRDDLLMDESNTLSLSAKAVFLQLNALKAFINKEARLASNYNYKLLQLIESRPYIQERFSQKYLAILNNYLIDCLQLKETDKFEQGLEKLKGVPLNKAYKHIKASKAQVFRMSTLLELNYLLSIGKFRLICEKENGVLEGLGKYKNKIGLHNQLTIYYLLLYANFACGNFERCIDWTNEVLNMGNSKIVASLQTSARLINILCHYELGNEILLSSSIQNLRKYQKRQGTLLRLEALVLSKISALIKRPISERKPVYREFFNELTELKANKEESGIMDNFDYLIWLKTKLNDSTFAEEFHIDNET